MSVRNDILTKAAELINGDRQKDYGPPEANFRRIAEFWSTYLGHPVSAADVAHMMVLLKVARSIIGYKEDTEVDAAGYIALAAELGASEAERGDSDAAQRIPVPECAWSSPVGPAD
jgi:hypothetical protein